MISNDLHLRFEGRQDAVIGAEMSDIEEDVEEDLGLGVDHSSDGEIGLVSDDEIGVGPGSDNLNERETGVENTAEGNDANADNNEPTGTKVEPKKKRVKNPRPKLDLERLKGPRGLTALDDSFKNFKFKGSGHEKEDLDALMLVYEHWTHRLFPILKFDDCLEQLENLGRKKEFQTLVKKVRLGLHTADDHVELFDDDDDDPGQPIVVGNPDVPPDDIFDSLLATSHIQQQVIGPSQPPPPPTPPITLTTEQLERIEANRRAAAAKRLARLSVTQEQSDNIIQN